MLQYSRYGGGVKHQVIFIVGELSDWLIHTKVYYVTTTFLNNQENSGGFDMYFYTITLTQLQN